MKQRGTMFNPPDIWSNHCRFYPIPGYVVTAREIKGPLFFSHRYRLEKTSLLHQNLCTTSTTQMYIIVSMKTISVSKTHQEKILAFNSWKGNQWLSLFIVSFFSNKKHVKQKKNYWKTDNLPNSVCSHVYLVKCTFNFYIKCCDNSDIHHLKNFRSRHETGQSWRQSGWKNSSQNKGAPCSNHLNSLNSNGGKAKKQMSILYTVSMYSSNSLGNSDILRKLSLNILFLALGL